MIEKWCLQYYFHYYYFVFSLFEAKAFLFKFSLSFQFKSILLIFCSSFSDFCFSIFITDTFLLFILLKPRRHFATIFIFSRPSETHMSFKDVRFSFAFILKVCIRNCFYLSICRRNCLVFLNIYPRSAYNCGIHFPIIQTQ